MEFEAAQEQSLSCPVIGKMGQTPVKHLENKPAAPYVKLPARWRRAEQKTWERQRLLRASF